MASLAILNSSPQLLDGPRLLHHLVANDCPQKVAIDYTSPSASQTITYAQLHHRSNSLANKLLTLKNSHPPSKNGRFIVPLFIRQCAELYIAQLAILKAGGAFCPIVLDVPEERLHFILNDVEARILLTTSQEKAQLPKLEGVQVVMADAEPLEDDKGEPSIAIDPTQAAYIMYTSGSTGQPKGVVLSHSAATQALLAHDQHIPLFSRFLQFASPTFDVSVFEIFFPFFRRSTLVCCDRRKLLNDLPGCINNLQIDAAELTPSVAASLLRTRASVPGLKVLLTIGEMLKKTVVEEFGGSSSSPGILQGMYGPTEATIHCTLQPDFQNDTSVGTIGIPLSTVSAFIVAPADPENPIGIPEILPIGTEGELAVGGHQLADGYLNRPEQTQHAFIHHPKYGQLYRTGDRALLRASDGLLECLGRLSSGQVKLRGQRIELGEIEYAASRAASCQSAVAEVEGGTLVVFCETNNSGHAETEIRDQIRQACRKWLPAYMIPGEIVLMDVFPYLASGKVDRKTLRLQFAESKEEFNSSEGKEALSATGSEISLVISGVLHTQISKETKLSVAGLDSLSAIRIASALKRKGYTQLDAALLLEAETVEDIETILNSENEFSNSSQNGDAESSDNAAHRRQNLLADPLLSHHREDIEDFYPVTAVQSAMLTETARNSQAYCNWSRFELDDQLDGKTLERALMQLSKHHDLLRSGFIQSNDIATGYSVVVWKSLSSNQIRRVTKLSYIFTIEVDATLLRPLRFQILERADGRPTELLLQIHHALYDQWSIDVFTTHLSALLQKGSIPVAPTTSFKAVSKWHTSVASGGFSSEASDFWQDHLHGFVPTSIPAINRRQTTASLARTKWHMLPDLTVAVCKDVARNHNISVPSIFQSAFAYLLATYSGSTDVTFGSVFSGRTMPISDIETVFGPLLATLPSRVDLSSVHSCKDLMRLAHKRTRDMQRHSSIPLAEIKTIAACAPDERLFESLFVWQESTLEGKNGKCLVREVETADFHEFGLVVEFQPMDSAPDDGKQKTGVAVRATFLENLLPHAQIQSLFNQIGFVVNHLVRNPDSAVNDLASALPLTSLSISNPEPTNYASSGGLIADIETQARINPLSLAITFASDLDPSNPQVEHLNFKSLNERANQFARHLQSLGTKSKDIICICMEKSINMYVAMLATLKMGAGYLPVLPETPIARVKSVLTQSRVKIAICDLSVVDTYSHLSGLTIFTPANSDLQRLATENLNMPYCGSDTAYAVFTSGSTGEPKGVPVTFANLSGNLAVLNSIYSPNPGDRMLQACSQAFDVSVFEIFFAFATGMTLCAAPKNVLFADLEQGIRILKATHLSMTATVASLVDPTNVPDVKFLVTSGEGVTETVHRKWTASGKRFLHQGYGPSETTNICTVNMRMRPDDALGLIGPPFPNTSAFVISLHDSKRFSILPQGALGEFAFGGEQVFPGYIGRPELNAQKLIRHPKYGLLYRSGDVGRILPNGDLLISGRVDDQVKIRGNRVELGEINACIAQHPAVRDCATLVVGNGAVEQSLVACWVPSKSDSPLGDDLSLAEYETTDVTDIFQLAEDKLPVYMIPQMLIPIPAMPLTSQGKLDRRRLKKLIDTLDKHHREIFSLQSDYISKDNPSDVSPLSELEKALILALAKILRITEDDITRSTSFFALGLNSLRAIAFAKQFNKTAKDSGIAAQVSIEKILRNPSIGRLAKAIDHNAEKVAKNNGVHQKQISLDMTAQLAELRRRIPAMTFQKIEEDCKAQGSSVEKILPCTPLQEAMLSASISAGNASYDNATIFQVFGDVKKLRNCWRALVARHAILRTHFVETDSSELPFVQVVVAEKELPWKEVSGIPSTPTKSTVSLTQPFRIDVCKSESKVLLILNMHHAIYDGISISLLFEEVESLFNGKSLAPAPSFVPFMAQSLAQRGPAALEFWISQFHDYNPKPFPLFASARESVQRSLKQTIPVTTTTIGAFCKRQAVTPLSVFQAAWTKTLACSQRNTDVCFGNVVSGRSSSALPVDVDRLVAPCFNTLPVRIKLSGKRTKITTNIDLIRSLHQMNLDSMDHQLSPLRRIQASSRAPHLRLFDSLLLVQPPAETLDSSLWKLESESGAMDLPIVLEIVPSQGEVYDVALHYLCPSIPEDLPGKLMKAFMAALTDCVRFTSSDVKEFLDFDDNNIEGILISKNTPQVDKHTANDLKQETEELWTPTELQLRVALSELSGIQETKIQRNTSIYQLGLDSLHAAQIAARLRRGGLDVDAADIIENLTPIAIAAAISQRSSKVSKSKNVDFVSFDRLHRHDIVQALRIQDKAIEAIRPCTAVQGGMIVQSIHSGGKLYVNQVTFEIPKNVKKRDIQRAWRLVQTKHVMLRTGFHHVGENGYAQIPFVMVNYTPTGVPSSPFIEELEPHSIVDQLHLPPWRVCISLPNDEDIKSTMTMMIHHALYDAESLQLVLRDFESAIADPRDLGPAQSIDTLLSTTLSAATDEQGDAKKFWKNIVQSAGFAKFPDMAPTVVPEKSLKATCKTLQVTTTEIDQYCRERGATVQALGQAAWASLLSAYLGEALITFGTIFSGRSTVESQQVAFPSLTTIPVCCNTTESHAKLVTDMASYNGSALRHRFLPLAEIQRLADNGGSPLFDTVFVYQKSASTSSEQFSWPMVQEIAGVDYTASLELETFSDDRVSIQLTFDISQIPEKQAQIMLEQYGFLLEILMERATEDFPSIWSILPAKEPTLPSQAQLLHEFVEIGAVSHPHKVALEFVHGIDERGSITSKSWNYKELDHRGNQVAHLIQQNGGKPGGIVALCMDKSAEATFAFLGILKAGSSFLPMDPELPDARKTFILKDSSAQILFVDAEFQGYIDTDVPIVRLKEEMLEGYPMEPLQLRAIDPQEAAYDLYTSGTTGNPKGCEITHENAVQAMLAFQRLFAGHWTSSSRWLQFASYWFDVSVLEQFWSWSVGIAVVGASRDLVLEDLPGFIQRLAITHIDLTPSLARIIQPDDVPSLHGGVFITGGEALKQEIIDAWGDKFTVCNGYGPTEATIGVTMNPQIGPDAKPSNIGPTFDNVGSYVLTPRTENPVLRGAVGELCVSGKLVGKGYLNRPDLTEKSFPTLVKFGERIYRTGDLVRLLADGSFYFIGRQDSQTKLRGQRLEIGEIDNAIQTSSENIVDVISMVVKDNDGARQTLVSFLATGHGRKDSVLELDAGGDAHELSAGAMQACRNRLPPYMVPTHIMPITFLPLTVNKKVDSKRLKSFYESLDIKTLQGLARAGAASQPLNTSESQIAHVLAEMLDIDEEEISRDSNFFSLGLSSITAINLASHLKRTGFRTASVAQVMKSPTIGALAKVISEGNQAPVAERDSIRQTQLSIQAFGQRFRGFVAQRLAVSTRDIEIVTPCTPLQEGLILESIRGSERPYFNEFHYRLPSTLDLKRLVEAFALLNEGIQMLRAAFVQTDDGIAQVIMSHSVLELSLPSLKPSEVTNYLEQRRQKWLDDNQHDIVRPIEGVIVNSGDENVLVISAHHATYDGVSWELLMSCLAEAYKIKKLPDCGPKFTDALAHGPLHTSSDSKDFWQNRLQGFSYTPLPLSGQMDNDHYFSTSVQTDFSSATEKIRRSLGVSHQAIVQSCFEVAIQETFPNIHVYGQVVSGRSIEMNGAEKIIGPMFNTLPSLIATHSEETWATAIGRLHEANTAVLPLQHTPIRMIRKWCGVNPSETLFDALFVFQHEQQEMSTTELWKQTELESRADYPLAFEVILHGDGTMTASVVGKSNYFDDDAIDSLLRGFQKALRASQNVTDRISSQFKISDKETSSPTEKHSMTNGELNGVHGFTWTTDATTIRQAVVQVINSDPTSVDEHSTIFSLGLDSIDAVKLASRLRKSGLPIQVSQLLRAQTIPRMIQVVNENKAASSNDIKSKSKLETLQQQLDRCLGAQLTKGTVEKILPATPNQEGLIADMLKSGFKEYYNHDVLRISPDVDMEKLKAAWQAVIDASAILRTGFIEVVDPDIEATFAQVIWPAAPVEFRSVSVSSTDDLDAELDKITHEVASCSRARSPLRLTIATCGPDTYMTLSLSHAQYDGHSLGVIHDDVYNAYQGKSIKHPSYYSVIEAALGATSPEARQFWDHTLSGAKVSSFPRLAKETISLETYRAERSCQITAEVAKAFCQKQGCSMQALAQTCWALVLASYTSSLEVLFGVVLACRDTEEAEQILFPVMNTVVLRAFLHGSRLQMLQYVQNAINDMLPYQRTPLRVIQAAGTKTVQNTDKSSGLFDTLFIYQHRPENSGAQTDMLYESVSGSSNVEYPVACEMEVVGNEILVRTACKSSVLDQDGAYELLGRMNQVLDLLVKAPEEPTVRFSGSEISICNLPAFELSQDFNEFGRVSDIKFIDSEDACVSPELSIVCEAFSKVSKVDLDSISPSATIESMGIDSISAIKVAALLRKESLNISVSDIIRSRTVKRIAEKVISNSHQTTANGSQPKASQIIRRFLASSNLSQLPVIRGIEQDNIEQILPATPGQVYMIKIWQASNGYLFYPTFKYNLQGSISVEDIANAWANLVARHAILRTIFYSTENENAPLLQVVLKKGPKSFSSNKNAQPNSNGQPMVALNVRPQASGCTLNLTIHHALYDAVSLPILMEDLQTLLTNTQPAVCHLKQEDFLALSLTPNAKGKAKEFWTEHLADVKPIKLAQPTAQGSERRIELFQPGLLMDSARLESRVREQNLTLQSLLFASYAKIYARSASPYTQETSNVVLGIYFSNRSHLPDLLSLASPTLNLVPLLVRSPLSTKLIDSAQQIQADLNEISSAENSAIGLWEIEQWTGVKIDTFVNFIKLPERSDNVDQPTSGVVIEEKDDKRSQAYARAIEPDNKEFTMPDGLQEDAPGAYQHSIDLEATIADGQLDIGFFAPEEMLNITDAQAMVGDLKELLEGAMS